MSEKFSTAYYLDHGIPVCPNGDKVRSDDEGLFCVVDGDRVPVTIIGGVVNLQPVAVPVVEPAPKKAAAAKKESTGDANG